jgi:hypothetical protein
MRKIFYSIFILLTFLVVSGVNAQPLPPTLWTPPNGATNVSLFPTFTWSSSSGASSYNLQVGTGPTTVIDISNIIGTSYTVTQAILTPLTSYYWRMSSNGTGGTGSWSGYFTFTTAMVIPAAPNLTSPTDGSLDVSLTPTLSWSSVSYAGYYGVQISTSPGFETTVLNVNGLNNPGYTVQPGTLANGIMYYWRANASNTGGTGLWSAVWHFTTVVAPPPPPSLISPANGATGVSVTPTLTWSTSSGATKYNIQIALSDNFSSIVYNDSSTTTSKTIPSGVLSGNQLYYWRVSAENIGGVSAWSSPVYHFTTGTAPPAAPLLLTPPDGATGVAINGVTFDWNSVAGAQSYRIQISLSSNFGTTFVNQSTGSTSQYTHNSPNFAYNTTYYWRVNATNSGGTGQWSTVWHFTTIIAAPPAPVLISPLNGATNVSLTPTMDWTDVSGATAYQLQISTSSSFSSFVLNVEVPQVSQYTVPSGVLQGYTLYYWRVASKNSGGQGAFSSSWSFTTVQTFNLNLKVFLEGFYSGTTHVQDTIKIYLAHSTNFQLKDSSLAYLDATGTASNVAFAKATSGYYWIVVKHRNHLETWSSILKNFSTGSTVSYDFTTSSGQAYGNNMKQVGSVWVLYGGDANQDGAVNSVDYEIYKTQFGLWGYKACDYNGDWFVDGYDLPAQNNFGHNVIHPTK